MKIILQNILMMNLGKNQSFENRKITNNNTSKYLYTINDDKTIKLNDDITFAEYNLDEYDNIYSMITMDSKIIFINDYLPLLLKQLNSVHEVSIHENTHEVTSKKLFNYFE